MNEKKRLKVQWLKALSDWQRDPTPANAARVEELGKKLNPTFRLLPH